MSQLIKSMTRYYDNVGLGYKWFWDLNKSMSIRIGYWDDKTKTLRDALRREDEFLSTISMIKENDHVLDAGCGVGGSAIFLAKTFGCRVTGITLSESQVQQACHNARVNGVDHLVQFYLMDYNTTSFADHSFDVVWAVESLSHTREKARFLTEAYRVLKPRGRLIGADYFSSKERFHPTIEKIRQTVFHGLNFEPFEWAQKFYGLLQMSRFKSIEFFDITPHTLPSARRFYWLSLFDRIFGGVLRVFNLRSEEQALLAKALSGQSYALSQRIHEYRCFYSEKH